MAGHGKRGVMAARQISRGGGVAIALSSMAGAFIGARQGQASAGLLVGLGVGVAVAVALWIWDKRQ